MNEAAPVLDKSRITLAQVMVAVLVMALLISMVRPMSGRISERGNVIKGISNCRQIITAMRIYSSDHDGKYPDAALIDPQSSNEVFRVLFTEEILDNELIFGCPISQFVPDGNIGGRDDTTRRAAVDVGENHWAMTKGLTESAPAEIPLVYENPVKAQWPPVWNANAKDTNARGRAWGKWIDPQLGPLTSVGHRMGLSMSGVIIGLNDSSVSLQPLESKKGAAVPLKRKDGKDLFKAAIDPKTFPKGEVLNVE